MYSKVWLRVLKFKITRLVPSGFDLKNVGEMNFPSSWAGLITMPFFRSLFTSNIICGEFWPLFIPTLLLIPTLSIEGSSKKSSVNPCTVSKISGSDVIFAHSFSLVEIQPPLIFSSFCCNHCYSSGRSCSNKLTLSKHILSFSWIWCSSLSTRWRVFFPALIV